MKPEFLEVVEELKVQLNKDPQFADSWFSNMVDSLIKHMPVKPYPTDADIVEEGRIYKGVADFMLTFLSTDITKSPRWLVHASKIEKHLQTQKMIDDVKRNDPLL